MTLLLLPPATHPANDNAATWHACSCNLSHNTKRAVADVPSAKHVDQEETGIDITMVQGSGLVEAVEVEVEGENRKTPNRAS
jgi:hypothetical protein